jgi:excinuclease ABC subunit A
VVRGARQHNLQGLDLELPRHALTVVTGVSGSGKSSLAFDTIYAEGQRRYVESVSTYAKQFLERLPRPDVDALEGLAPAVAIRQAAPTQSARSTVATATELADYLRLLFARAGEVHCPVCDRRLTAESPGTIAEEARRAWPEGIEVAIAAPIEIPRRLPWGEVRAGLEANGYLKAWTPRGARELSSLRAAPRGEPLLVLVDRFAWQAARSGRLSEACEAAYRRGEGRLWLVRDGRGESRSERHRCPDDGTLFPDLRPTLFSFNSPYGACPTCRGFGDVLEFDEDRIVPDPERTLAAGAIDPWAGSWRRVFGGRLRELSRRTGLRLDVPWRELPEGQRRLLLDGGDGFRGVRPFLERLQRKSYKPGNRFLVKRYQCAMRCRDCLGTRLRAEARRVRVAGALLPEVLSWTVGRARRWAEELPGRLAGEAAAVAAPLVEEILSRLRYLERVDLSYLTLDRTTRTLSGGEAQRIELATALGANLVDALYVLDEPTVGLHARDTERLLGVLLDLVRRGNTLLVVEHDPMVVRAADWLVDLGPGAGSHGGRLLHAGPPEDLPATPTGRYLSGQQPVGRRPPAGKPRGWLVLAGARLHNLRSLTARFPLGRLTCVTGVSGSGKSSLIEETLHPAVAARLGSPGVDGASAFDRLSGAEDLERVVLVDQSPIGRSPRSNPATYVKAFEPMRALLAGTPLARERGLGPGWFSFNVEGGRCETCRGDGAVRVEMVFLADLFLPCDACGGSRYQSSVLEVRYRGQNVRDLLDRTVDEAIAFFADRPEIVGRLRPLARVGLGYLRLGQPATTLSGGESQRLKLARELGSGGAARTLYLLDEPTVGLHAADVQILLDALSALVEQGATVIVVEHNLEVARLADWIVDLGPGGGEDGGRLVAEGTPEEVARAADSVLAPYLRQALERAAGEAMACPPPA